MAETPAPQDAAAGALNGSGQATAREDLCRFLAGCWYEPSPMFAEEDLFGSICAAAAQIDSELVQQAQALKTAFEAVPLQELLVDYTRLFLGAPQALAKPYASVWLSSEPQLMQDSVQELLKLYEQGGFEVAADFMDLPDHVAVELEFLYLLTWQHHQALEAGDAQAQQAVEVLRTAFLVGHLGRWLGGFVLAVHEHAQTRFYEALAELTERFVRLEGQWQQGAQGAGAVQH